MEAILEGTRQVESTFPLLKKNTFHPVFPLTPSRNPIHNVIVNISHAGFSETHIPGDADMKTIQTTAGTLLMALGLSLTSARGNLVSHFNFDNNLTDGTATLVATGGSASFGTGVVGNAVNTVDPLYYTVGGGAAAHLPLGQTTRTMSLWVNSANFTGAAGSWFGYGDNVARRYFALGQTYTGDPGEVGFMGFAADVDTGFIMSTSTWYHVLTTYEFDTNSGEDVLEIWVNGSSQGVFNPGNAFDLNTTNGSSSGRIDVGWQDGRIVSDALVDEVGLWDRKLTAGEIKSLGSLVNTGALNYDVSLAEQLFQAHAGAGNVNIGGLNWQYTTGMSGTLGEVDASGSQYSLVLDDGAGTGMVAAIPEPGTLSLVALALSCLYWVRRKR